MAPKKATSRAPVGISTATATRHRRPTRRGERHHEGAAGEGVTSPRSGGVCGLILALIRCLVGGPCGPECRSQISRPAAHYRRPHRLRGTRQRGEGGRLPPLRGQRQLRQDRSMLGRHGPLPSFQDPRRRGARQRVPTGRLSHLVLVVERQDDLPPQLEAMTDCQRNGDGTPVRRKSGSRHPARSPQPCAGSARFGFRSVVASAGRSAE